MRKKIPNSSRKKQSLSQLSQEILSLLHIRFLGNSIMASESADSKLKLYSYWRSSSSFRVRIVLNLKGLKYEYKAVNLLKGEQFDPEFLKYLDEKYPQHPLLPHDVHKRAINYQAANIVASSIQPLHNLSILNYIEEKAGPDEKLPWVLSLLTKGFTGEIIHGNKFHFVGLGSEDSIHPKVNSLMLNVLSKLARAALEKLLKDHAGRYAIGDEILLADVFLAPQIHAAVKRFTIDMTNYPTLARVYEAYNEIPAFRDALPENQPDATSGAH